MRSEAQVVFKELKETVRGIQFTDFKRTHILDETMETCRAYTNASNFVNISYMIGEEDNRSSFVIQDQNSNLYRTSSFIDMYTTCGKLLFAQGRGLDVMATEQGKGDINV